MRDTYLYGATYLPICYTDGPIIDQKNDLEIDLEIVLKINQKIVAVTRSQIRTSVLKSQNDEARMTPLIFVAYGVPYETTCDHQTKTNPIHNIDILQRVSYSSKSQTQSLQFWVLFLRQSFEGDKLLGHHGVNGHTAVKVFLCCSNFDCHSEALQHFITTQTNHVETHNLCVCVREREVCVHTCSQQCTRIVCVLEGIIPRESLSSTDTCTCMKIITWLLFQIISDSLKGQGSMHTYRHTHTHTHINTPSDLAEQWRVYSGILFSWWSWHGTSEWRYCDISSGYPCHTWPQLELEGGGRGGKGGGGGGEGERGERRRQG